MVDGYWGAVTSSLDWCEENYQLTHYIAEFWNTISNVLLCLVPLQTAIELLSTRCQRKGSKRKFPILPDRFILAFFLMAIVGAGSFAFHATLKYEMQLLDELPMLVGLAQSFFCAAYSHDPVKGTRKNLLLAVGLMAYTSSVTLSYLLHKDPLIHQGAFGGLLLCLIGTFTFRARKMTSQSKQMGYSPLGLLAGGVGFASVGFTLWLVDVHVCAGLERARAFLPVLLQPFLQLHAWWHVFSMYSLMWILYGMVILDQQASCTACSLISVKIDRFGLPYFSQFTKVD